MKLCQNEALSLDALALLNEATAYFEDNAFESGHQVLLNAMERFPSIWQFPYTLGTAILTYSRSPEKAVVLLEQASHLAPNQITVWTQLAHAYRGNQQTQEALNVLHKAVSLPVQAEDTVKAYLLLAELLESLNYLDESASALQNALELKHLAWLETALKAYQFYARHEAFEDALNVLENALTQYPEEAMLYFLKGVSLERLDRAKEAEAAYQQAVELGGQSPELHRQMAGYFAQQGEALKAIQHLVSVLELEPEDLEALEALAHLLRQQFKWSASQQVLQRLLASHPTHATAWIQLAETHEQLGQVAEAIEAYNHALELLPNRSLELRKSLVVSPLPPATPEAARDLQHRIEISLKALSLNPPRIENPAVDLGVTPRILMQQGLWHDGLATLWKEALAEIQRLSKADFTQAVSKQTTQKSIVVITRDLGSTTNPTPAWMPPVQALDRKAFRLHWIQIGSSIHAPQGSRFHEGDTMQAIASHDWHGIQEAVLSQSPDVLLFSEAFKDVVSMALYWGDYTRNCTGDYAETQIDLATCTPSCLAPLRPLSSTSKRFKEDFGANYEYPLLAIEVIPSRWTVDFVKGIQGLLEANPFLQVVLYFVGEEAVKTLLSSRLKAVLSEDTQNRITWMSLPYAEAQRLFQVADAVLRLEDTCRSPLMDYAFAFGTSIYNLADLEALKSYLAQSEAERQIVRQHALDSRYAFYTPAFIEAQAQALVAQWR